MHLNITFEGSCYRQVGGKDGKRSLNVSDGTKNIFWMILSVRIVDWLIRWGKDLAPIKGAVVFKWEATFSIRGGLMLYC